MAEDYTISSPLPDAVNRATGAAVEVFMGLFGSGLTKSSTSGYDSPGVPDPASMTFDNPTEITKRFQGAPNVEIQARVAQQSAMLKTDFQDWTPFLREIKNKTNIRVVDTIATTLFTTGIISVGSQAYATLTLTGTSVPATGDWLRIPISSGATARNSYRYVAGVNTIGVNNILVTLEHPLKEPPLAGVTVSRIVDQQLYEASGSRLQEYTSLFKVSGDDGSAMTIFSERGYCQKGDDKVGNGKENRKYAIELNALAKKILIDGFYQPVLWDTNFKPPNRN